MDGPRSSTIKKKRPGPLRDPGRWVRLLFQPGELREVEPVEIHHLGPGGHEVVDELGLRVRGAVDFRKGAELGVGAEDEIDAGAGPFQFSGLPVAAFEGVLGLVERSPFER